MVAVITNVWFDRFILANILLNSLMLAIVDYSLSAVDHTTLEPDKDKSARNFVSASLEPYFTAVFTLECLLKVIGTGFVVEQGSYLRDKWNWCVGGLAAIGGRSSLWCTSVSMHWRRSRAVPLKPVVLSNDARRCGILLGPGWTSSLWCPPCWRPYLACRTSHFCACYDCCDLCEAYQSCSSCGSWCRCCCSRCRSCLECSFS